MLALECREMGTELRPLRPGNVLLERRSRQVSSARGEDEDHVVDCSNALEILLAIDSPQLETPFRFRLRGAALLPKEFGTVKERIKLMGWLYDLRSSTVHGGKKAHRSRSKAKSLADEMRKASDEAERVLRAIFLWFIEWIDEPNIHDRTLEELDAAMVTGGQTWAKRPRETS